MAQLTKKRKNKKKPGAQSRRRRDYEALPEHLPLATEFSDDPQLGDSLSVMRLVKEFLSGGQPGTIHDLWDRTAQRCDMSKTGGRPRSKGDWSLLYTTAFGLSQRSEMHAFWKEETLSPLWDEAGFDGRRPYPTMWLRFAELEDEQCIQALEDAADELVQLAMSKEPRIGRELYVDATSVHSRARLHHDCPDREACRAAGHAKEILDPASPDLVKETRKNEAEEPAALKLRHPSAQRTGKPSENDKYPHYVWVGQHRYGVKDPDVGVRLYKTKGSKVKKFWPGYLDMVAVDGFTGGSLQSLIAPANRQEFNLYPHLLDRSISTMGGVIPEGVGGDRGLSVSKVFKHNAELGIISALPFRKPHSSMERHDLRCDAFDEHGVGRCPICGGPGKQIPGFTFVASGGPRVRFRCESPNTVECMTLVWSLNPADYDHGWRSLIGISRLSERYQAMRKIQSQFERAHRERRKRYAIDGADETGKLKRFGIGAHRLRSAAARFLEWFRICLRNGYLPGYKGKLNPAQPRMHNGNERLRTTRNVRRWQGLDLPYGKNAFALGLAVTPDVPKFRPPSKKRGAPPPTEDDDG